jgi:hypothetical protein
VNYRFKPIKRADRSLFTDEEKGIFIKVLDILRKNSANAVSSLSHQFRLWREVGTGYTIPLDLFQIREGELGGPEYGPFMADDGVSDMTMECGIPEFLVQRSPETLLMGEASLAKDWLRSDEDEAWADL